MHNPSKEKYSKYLLYGPAVIALILYFWSAFQSDFSKKEGREAIPVANMFQGKSIWLPKINDNQYRTKPPMFYWAGLLSSKVLGKVNEISVRLPSVLAGAGVVFLTTLLGFWLFSPVTGFMAGLIAATSPQFIYLSSLGRIDMLFVFFITLAMTAFWKMIDGSDARTRNLFSWLGATTLGFAVLTKGPLGLIFPSIALFLYTRIQKKQIPWARLLLVPLAMTFFWLIQGSIEGGKEFTSIIYRETIGRITGDPSIAFHNQPFYIYFFMIAYGLLPWSLFIPVVLWQGVQNHLKDPRWLYPAVAFVTLFIFLSLIPGKRDAYLAPAYPMASLMIAHGISYYARKDKPSFIGWTLTWRMIMVSLIGLGIFLPIVAFKPDIPAFFYNLNFIDSNDRWVAHQLVQNHFPPGILLVTAGVGILIFSGAIHMALKRNSIYKVWAGMAVVTGLGLILVYGPAARTANLYYSLKPFSKKVHRMVGSQPLNILGNVSEDLFFYVNRPAHEEKGGMMGETLHENPETYLIIPISQSAATLAANPGFKVVLETDERIKRKHQLIKYIAPQSQQ